MRKFKVGQKVYYYLDEGDYTGYIIECVIKKATKDLETGKITYQVTTDKEDILGCRCFYITNRELTDEYLYASKKQIEKEYKDEIAYNKLYREIRSLEDVFLNLRTLLESKEEYKITGTKLFINDTEQSFNKAYISAKDVILDGKVSLMSEVEKLRKRVKSLEKKIEPKTKKRVESNKKNETVQGEVKC